MKNDITDEKKNETNMVKAPSSQDAVMLSPYYLHDSDEPRNIITTVQLKGENYEDWAKNVRNALHTKRNIGFINGTLKKPTTEEEIEQ